MNETVFVQVYGNRHSIFNNCYIVKCERCAMVFVNPMPDRKELEIYNSGYFDNAHGGMQTHPLTVAFHSAINLLRVLFVYHFFKTEGISVQKILEIGPGGGHFARHWIKMNTQTTQYSGVESDESCHARLISSKVDVFLSIEEVPADREFDLVVISHVLEHTDNPDLFIDQCTRGLRKGGALFIEVPCNDYQHKPSVEPHLLFFDKEPMRFFLRKHGFTIGNISYYGNTIADLAKPTSYLEKMYSKARNLLLSRGVVFPFAGYEPGLEGLGNSLERACVKPFNAHKEQTEPSWWLRVIAIKN